MHYRWLIPGLCLIGKTLFYSQVWWSFRGQNSIMADSSSTWVLLLTDCLKDYCFLSQKVFHCYPIHVSTINCFKIGLPSVLYFLRSRVKQKSCSVVTDFLNLQAWNSSSPEDLAFLLPERLSAIQDQQFVQLCIYLFEKSYILYHGTSESSDAISNLKVPSTVNWHFQVSQMSFNVEICRLGQTDKKAYTSDPAWYVHHRKLYCTVKV